MTIAFVQTYRIALEAAEALRSAHRSETTAEQFLIKAAEIECKLKEIYPYSPALEIIFQRLGRLAEKKAAERRGGGDLSVAALTSIEKKELLPSYAEFVGELRTEIRGSLDFGPALSKLMFSKDRVLVYGDSRMTLAFVKELARQRPLLFLTVRTQTKGCYNFLSTETKHREISFEAACTAVGSVTMVILECELVTQTGACLAPAGSLVLAITASRRGIECNAVCATYMIQHGDKYINPANRFFQKSPFYVTGTSTRPPTPDIRIVSPMFDYISPYLINFYLTSESFYRPFTIEFLNKEKDNG